MVASCHCSVDGGFLRKFDTYQFYSETQNSHSVSGDAVATANHFRFDDFYAMHCNRQQTFHLCRRPLQTLHLRLHLCLQFFFARFSTDFQFCLRQSSPRIQSKKKCQTIAKCKQSTVVVVVPIARAQNAVCAILMAVFVTRTNSRSRPLFCFAKFIANDYTG